MQLLSAKLLRIYRRVCVWWRIRRAKRLCKSLTSSWRREHTVIVGGKQVRLETVANPDSPIIDWTGTERFRFWGRRIQFYIYVDDSMPTESHLALLGRLMNESKASRSEIEAALLKYYEQYIAPSDLIEERSSVMDLRRFRKSIGDPTIHIGMSSHPMDLGWTLAFSADWDDEHEIRVDFNGDAIVDVGN